MARLPLISGAKAVKAFSKAGWMTARQTGSHLIMIKHGSLVTLSVPMHSEIDRGTLREAHLPCGAFYRRIFRSIIKVDLPAKLKVLFINSR